MSYDLSGFGDDLNIAVIGASGGIGHAFVVHLLRDNQVKKIYAFSRNKVDFNDKKVISHSLDYESEASIEVAAGHVEGELDIIIVATGFLHDENLKPEKSLRDLSVEGFEKNFTINCIGPALVAKYFVPKLSRQTKSVMAIMSARVGSISDNEMGGWYAYRAAKAAVNMVVKNISIEVVRRNKQACVVALHPGTVSTELSAPFRGNVKYDIFTSEQSAEYLLNVMNGVTPDNTGKIFDWNAKEIAP